MKFVSKARVVLAAFTLLSLSSCSRESELAPAEAATPASDGLRMATLRNAALEAGFVRADALRLPVDRKKREAGGLIFASPLMSLNGSISCRDCHLDAFASTDGLPNGVGVGATGEGHDRMKGSNGRILPRNALAFWGRGSKGFDTFFWDGRVSVKNGLVVSQFGRQAPSRDPLIVAVHLPSVELREMIADTPKVREEFLTEKVDAAEAIQAKLANRFANDKEIGPILSSAYSVSPDKLQFINAAESLASFIREEFRIRQTRLERFLFHNGTISKQELAGGILFYGRGKCASCHNGPYFSDFSFHAVAFPQAGFGKNGFGIDEGRYNTTLNPGDRFLFRTPPLFNVSKTSPYSHSGSVTRLEDAIVAHFDPLRLVDTRKMSTRERADLYARLGPASREPLPTALTDAEVRSLAAFLRMLDFEKS